LITGVDGQDGSYLSELLAGKGYEVHGLVRPGSKAPDEPFAEHVIRHEIDLLDPAATAALVAELQPRELYHLAAPSVVWASWNDPPATIAAITGSIANLLHAVHEHSADTRVFNASSSEIFRGTELTPQDESTPPATVSPYGAAKLFGNALGQTYRAARGLHCSSGILYNHESPRRPAAFVTRKIVNACVSISAGMADELVLGDLRAKRDWSYAGDFVEAMWLMLQQDEADDYVLASGRLHTVGQLVDTVCRKLGVNAHEVMRIDQSLVRAETSVLQGDPSKARERLGWEPKVNFDQLIEMMIEAERERLGVGA
jgi:GDPmannose 4,6-dehydratase